MVILKVIKYLNTFNIIGVKMTTILNISDAATIALHSMTYICKNNNRAVSVREIANYFDVSENHLSKVLQRLTKANLLISSKGPAGGFKLNKKSSDISLLQIYESIEGAFKDNNCLLKKENPQCESCIMGDLIKFTNNKVKTYLKTKKLSAFCKTKKNKDKGKISKV